MQAVTPAMTVMTLSVAQTSFSSIDSTVSIIRVKLTSRTMLTKPEEKMQSRLLFRRVDIISVYFQNYNKRAMSQLPK